MKMYFNDFKVCVETLDLMVYQLEENLRKTLEEYGEELTDNSIRPKLYALKDALLNNVMEIKELEKEENRKKREERKKKKEES